MIFWQICHSGWRISQKNLEATEVHGPVHISQDSDSEHSTKVAMKWRKHSIFTHFPKNRNCDVCLKTKITKASCRRRTGEALPRTEEFRHLITAVPKVLNEECESGQSPVRCRGARSCHPMDPVLSVPNTNFPCPPSKIRKFLLPSQKPKVFYSDNSLEFGKSCKESSWNHQTSTLHRSETNGTAESDSETREREDQSEIDSPPVPVSSLNVDDRTVKPVICRETNHERSQANQKSQKTNKEETTIERRHPLFADSGRAPLSSEIPEWLQEFREKFVDDEIPGHGDSHASSSHEVSLEPTSKRSEDLGEHSVHTHFPEDRNCEICKRTNITRAPCRRRNGGAVPRAENPGDLITADHKVLTENCESRNNHRYDSRGEGLGYTMDPVVSVQNKNFSGNKKELAKVLGAR